MKFTCRLTDGKSFHFIHKSLSTGRQITTSTSTCIYRVHLLQNVKNIIREHKR